MEERKLNFDAPFLSIRRIQTKPENLTELETTRKRTTSKRTKKVNGSSQETEHETLVRFLKHDHSFDHVMEPSSVPFTWEQTPGRPKNHHNHMATTLVQESELIKAFDVVSSTASFSVNCSTNGVISDDDENGDRSSDVSKDDVILDLIMSKFLPAAKAIAMKQQKKQSPLYQQEKKKKKQSIAQHKVSMVTNQDFNHYDYDDNHGDGIDQKPYSSSDSKKALFGFMPRNCAKNSMDVLSRVRTCQNLAKSDKIITPKPRDSVYKTKSPPSKAIPRILALNKVMSKSQEIYPIPRFSTERSSSSSFKTNISLSKSGEILRISRNPTRLQRTMSERIQSQGTRFLVEQVKRRSSINKNRSRNTLFSQVVSQPPLPKTPSESWLCRTLPRISAASVVSDQAVGFKKTISQSTKWETIVKTSSYKHHDHVRYYSEEPIVVHPSRTNLFTVKRN
ncbi:unnamed protein product [Cochlearia groenlandica]